MLNQHPPSTNMHISDEEDKIAEELAQSYVDYRGNPYEELLSILENKIMARFDKMEKQIASFSLKQIKRKRTNENRCKAVNRKGEMCNGFCCKRKSTNLCYAHYVLLSQKSKSNYLYSKK
jgi:hypothetical protein